MSDMAYFNVQRSRPVTPWSALFDDFFRDFDTASSRPGATLSASRGVYPAVNLYEDGKGYVLTAELPGVSPEAINVSLEGATVTLQGERKIDYAAAEGTSVHRRERQSGSFRRAFELPTEIDVDAAKAVHKNGVLTLHLPKLPENKPREIAVQSS